MRSVIALPLGRSLPKSEKKKHKPVTFDWLLGQAKDQKTQANLEKMIASQRRFCDTGRNDPFGHNFVLRLKGGTFVGRSHRPYSTMMVYKEMCLDNIHQEVGFDKASGTIIDIGANEGLYTVRMCLQNPGLRAICVEPSPSTQKLLRTNLRLNGLSDHVRVCKVAVWSDDTPQSLWYIPGNSSNAGLERSPVHSPWLSGSSLRKKKVPCKTLDEIYTGSGVQEIDILKIDTEGAELEVLKGGKTALPHIRRIVLEYHSEQLRNDAIEFLSSRGFALSHETIDDPVNIISGDLYFVHV